jgi:hypothetical protein
MLFKEKMLTLNRHADEKKERILSAICTIAPSMEALSISSPLSNNSAA